MHFNVNVEFGVVDEVSLNSKLHLMFDFILVTRKKKKNHSKKKRLTLGP